MPMLAIVAVERWQQAHTWLRTAKLIIMNVPR
jgi:hypothetical protein